MHRPTSHSPCLICARRARYHCSVRWHQPWPQRKQASSQPATTSGKILRLCRNVCRPASMLDALTSGKKLVAAILFQVNRWVQWYTEQQLVKS